MIANHLVHGPVEDDDDWVDDGDGSIGVALVAGGGGVEHVGDVAAVGDGLQHRHYVLLLPHLQADNYNDLIRMGRNIKDASRLLVFYLSV